MKDSLDWMHLVARIPTLEEIYEEIRRRRAAGERGVDLSKEYGVTPSMISKIYHDAV